MMSAFYPRILPWTCNRNDGFRKLLFSLVLLRMQLHADRTIFVAALVVVDISVVLAAAKEGAAAGE